MELYCPISHDNISHGKDVCIFKCGHFIGSKHLQELKNTINACPTCRGTLDNYIIITKN